MTQTDIIRQEALALAILIDVRVIAAERVAVWADSLVQNFPNPSPELCVLATVKAREDEADVREKLFELLRSLGTPAETRNFFEVVYTFLDDGHKRLRVYSPDSPLWCSLMECVLDKLRGVAGDATLLAKVMDQLSFSSGWPERWADACFEAGDTDYGLWYPTKDLIVSAMIHELERSLARSTYPRPFAEVARAHYDSVAKVFVWDD